MVCSSVAGSCLAQKRWIIADLNVSSRHHLSKLLVSMPPVWWKSMLIMFATDLVDFPYVVPSHWVIRSERFLVTTNTFTWLHFLRCPHLLAYIFYPRFRWWYRINKDLSDATWENDHDGTCPRRMSVWNGRRTRRVSRRHRCHPHSGLFC